MIGNRQDQELEEGIEIKLRCSKEKGLKKNWSWFSDFYVRKWTSKFSRSCEVFRRISMERNQCFQNWTGSTNLTGGLVNRLKNCSDFWWKPHKSKIGKNRLPSAKIENLLTLSRFFLFFQTVYIQKTYKKWQVCRWRRTRISVYENLVWSE